ncbi:Target of rapamycin complex 1 subunit kog1 [Coemansia sp. RSA 552]|nr:Target of rapamycin complex 1 subunit kog1 [Coemansia sp. RSA 552]
MCTEEIPAASVGGITCISHDGVSGNIFAVGSANGLVRVMDRRLDARSGVVANWREHSPHRVCNVFMRPGQMEVVSASSNGDVKYWDLRHREPVFTLTDTHPDSALEYMAAHESAPVVLTASSAAVRLWNRRGNPIGLVQPAAAQPNGGASAYVRTWYGAKTHSAAHVTAATIHQYLPVALMVADDGRVSSIQPRPSARPQSVAPPAGPPTLASSRASSMLG